MHSTLKQKIENRSATIGVIGLGYVGLPLVIEFVRKGFPVIGYDTDPRKVCSLKENKTYIKHIPEKTIKEINATGKFHPTTDEKKIREMDAVIICVPTPLTPQREPDMTYIVNSCEIISRNLRKGQLVSLESTTYPGTTDEVMKPILEKSGLKADKDFILAYSPEREDPNNQNFTTSTIPKVVGCDDPEGLKVTRALYDAIVVKTIPVSSTRAAESTKLLENIYRSVNIALVNELKMLFTEMDIDVWEVINAAATKPFGFHAFYPGPGLGGHCLVGEEKVRYFKTPSPLAGEGGGEGDRGCVLSCKELFESQKTEGKYYEKNGLEIIKVNGLSVSSIDVATGTQSRKPITHLFRRNYGGPIVEILTDDNRTIKVTDRHPMLRIKSDSIEVIEARKLMIGDLLPFCDKKQSDVIATPSASRGKQSHVVAKTNLFSTQVKEIKLENHYKAPVYSIEVADNHTFAAAQGIFVHNCIPIDPFYLTWKAREYDMPTKFIELAGEINTHMPRYVVNRVSHALNDHHKAIRGSKILVMGIAYKKDIDDMRESPSLKLIELLEEKGAKVDYHDPHIPVIPETREHAHLAGRKSIPTSEIGKYDCVLIATDHTDVPYRELVSTAKLIVDTRHAIPGSWNAPNVVRA